MGENDVNALPVDVYFFASEGKKTLRFQNYLDTCSLREHPVLSAQVPSFTRREKRRKGSDDRKYVYCSQANFTTNGKR